MTKLFHADVYREARGIRFGLSIHLQTYVRYVSGEGSAIVSHYVFVIFKNCRSCYGLLLSGANG